jgi:hypothetical protein
MIAKKVRLQMWYYEHGEKERPFAEKSHNSFTKPMRGLRTKIEINQKGKVKQLGAGSLAT